MSSLVERAFSNRARKMLYAERRQRYPTLAEQGDLPTHVDDILNDKAPWLCHGLAFRMATYSEARENLFRRWVALLQAAQNASGWEDEFAHWTEKDDHWAQKWNKFYHFLWLLQCYEYFADRGLDVSFPAPKSQHASAMPDLLIQPVVPHESAVYAECYFYSKWWPNEHFLEELLHVIDPRLNIHRKFNLASAAVTNPFSDNNFSSTLRLIDGELTPDSLVRLRRGAEQEPLQRVCSIKGDFQIEVQFKGPGLRPPDPNNSNGCPAASLQAFATEIIKAKEPENGLKDCRPNILMTNGLGVDFQMALLREHNPNDETSAIRTQLGNIDELLLAGCGVDEKLKNCSRIRRILRKGHIGLLV